MPGHIRETSDQQQRKCKGTTGLPVFGHMAVEAEAPGECLKSAGHDFFHRGQNRWSQSWPEASPNLGTKRQIGLATQSRGLNLQTVSAAEEGNPGWKGSEGCALRQ